MKAKVKMIRTVFVGLALTSVFIACGGGGGLSVSSLSQLPDPATMVATSSTDTGLSLAAVSGEAPLLSELSSDPDGYFWNDLIAKLSDEGLDAEDFEQADVDAFWGGVTSGPSGQGGCFMAQNVGMVFSNLLEGATSSCYMKSMPTASSGVTISPEPEAGRTTIFDQSSDDHLVHVAISNITEGEDEEKKNMDVYITVFGTNSTGSSDIYKVRLAMCNDGDLNGVETFEVNKSDKTYVSKNVNKEGAGKGFSSELKAYLTSGSGDGLAFDTDKERSISMHGSFNNEDWASNIKISSGLIYSVMRSLRQNGGEDELNRNSSVAQFTGSDVTNARFLAAGYKGYSYRGDDTNSNTFSGALEWHDSFYAAISNSESSLYSSASSQYDDSSSFFADDAAIDFDTEFSGVSCGGDVKYTVTMDFDDSVVAKIRTDCEGNKNKMRDQNYCWSGDVHEVQEKVFEYFQSIH